MTALPDTSSEEALIAHFKTLAGTTPVAWPNVLYTPVTGTSYYRVNFLGAPVDRLTHGNADRHTGIMQIDCVIPSKKGELAAISLARAVASHFDRIDLSGDNGEKIKTIKPPYLGPGQQENDWYFVPVSITYSIIF